MSLWTRFLVWYGIRSKCCGAKTWYWDTFKGYCSKCEARV